MMNTYRLEIEQLILVSYLNQYLANEFEQSLYEAEVLPFEMFKANRTNKMVAKAIYNLMSDKIVIRDTTVLNYIEQHTKVNYEEWNNLISKCDTSFNLMLGYMDELKKIDEREHKMNVLGSML